MRGAFIRTLTELADREPRIFLLTGDLGYMALEPFAEKHPDRFINVGVAEQNMVGIATGLAEAGFMPFCYSIVTFASLRPYEFIRNGPVLHQLPVRIVGVGGGVEYGHNGASHYGLEDVAVMRVQPGLTVIAPADSAQTSSALEKTHNLPGPVYYRLGKDDRTIVPGLQGEFELGRCQNVRQGKDILIISMGSISFETATACDALAQQGISCTHLIVSSLNPAPTTDLIAELSRFEHVMAVEAHYANGGLGSLVAETIAENRLRCRLTRCAIKDIPDGVTGSQKYLYRKLGLAPESLVSTAMSLLDEVPA
jgi:transketolase